MQPEWKKDRLPAPIGAAFSVGAGICIAVGAASLIDAADRWQDILGTVYAWRSRSIGGCPGPWTVPGWGDGAVLVFAGIALVLVAVTALAAMRFGIWPGLGFGTSLLALIPITIMWMDTLSVASSPTGDCDSIGLSGAASVALDRAGWLFFASAILCLLSASVLNARHRGPATSWLR